MSNGSGDNRYSLAEQRPLFQFGSSEQRFESVVHSLLVLFLAFTAGSVLVVLGNSLLGDAGLTGPILTETVPTALHFLGILLVATWYLHWRGDHSLIGLRIPTRKDILIVVLGAVGLIVTIMTLDILFSAYGLEPGENVAVEAGKDNPELFLYYVPIVLLLNAPAEELLFRGVIQGLFRRAYGVVPAILAAALIFGFVHYLAVAGNGGQMVYVTIAFVSGVVLGALYEYTGNLLVPTVVHAIWNSIVYLNLYAQETVLVAV